MKILRVGDVHVKPSNLKESEILMQFILHTSKNCIVDKVEFLGDLNDLHSIVRLEVLEFWQKYFNVLSKQSFKTIALVGNHDLTGSYNNNYSSLHPFLSLENPNFKIVYEPYLDGKFGYLPYIHDNDQFVIEANKLADRGATVLIAHPTFKGAVYDNGTDVANGINPDLLDSRFLHLIGGHIHTELTKGRVWYTGNPRWMTKSCSNKQKGIWLCDHDDTGLMTSKEFISTGSVCTPIRSLIWKEGENKPEIPYNAKVDIELVGSSDWVSKTKKELVGISVSSKITDIKRSKERKSGKSLKEFLEKHYEIDENKRTKLIKYFEDMNLV